MCSNYRPVTRSDRMLRFFGVIRERDEMPADMWPTGLAPFIRLAEEGSGFARVADDGIFGLLPHFATELAAGRRTYNARSETVHQLPSFKESWARGRRCIIPAELIYEPFYPEKGKPERWAIFQEHDIPMGIAGIYRRWWHPQDGRSMLSFAMLTVNADDHPLMSRFHRPGEEKRMVVILHPDDYGAWLTSPVTEASRFFKQWHGPLIAEPRLLPPRAPRASSGRIVQPKPADPGLF